MDSVSIDNGLERQNFIPETWLGRRVTPEILLSLVTLRQGFFLLSCRVNSCADLFVPESPSCVRHAPKVMRTLKIPYPSVVKESRPRSQPVVWRHENTAHKKTKSGSALLWLLAFPRGKQPKFPVHCTGTRKLSNLI